MKIYCPNCGVKGSAEDSYSGRKIRCPKCQDEFMLNPDMAIDQDTIPATPSASQGQAGSEHSNGNEALAAGAAILGGAAAGAAAGGSGAEDAGASLHGLEEEEITLDFEDEHSEFGGEPGDDEPGDESLDWGDFGAELDKEIAESEELEQDGEDDLDLADEESPVDALADLDDTLSAEELEAELDDAFDESLDADLSEFDEMAAVDHEPADDSNEEVAELTDGEDVEDVPEDLLVDLGDEAEEATDIETDEELDLLEEIEPEAVEEGVEDSEDSDAGDVVMPLFVDETDAEEVQEEILEAVEDESPDFAGEDLSDEEAHSLTVEEAGEAEDVQEDTAAVDEGQEEPIEDEPYGLDKEQCWQCGKEDSAGEPFVAIDGRLYCTDCMPEEDSETIKEEATVGEAAAMAGAAAAAGAAMAAGADDNADKAEDARLAVQPGGFTIGAVLRESWEKVKGVKGAVWAGSALMYAVLLVVIAGDAFLMPSMMTPDAGATGYLISAGYQMFIQVVTMLFVAGLLFMGIRRAADDPVSWKMIFHGFSFAGKIIVVTILQFILIIIGYLLLILPGIYLTVGYLMAIPLIVDQNVAPWQALEMSRKAIHKVWWKVLGLYIIMGLIFMVASIPLGIGLIWAWPMSMVVAGVVYHRLFKY